jgi:hypothetical protein
MHVVSFTGGVETSKGSNNSSQPSRQQACWRPLAKARGRPPPFQVPQQPAADDRRVAARVVANRLKPPRFRQHTQDQSPMVILSEPKVPTGVAAGVGSPLPHMQDCVYLGESSKQVLSNISMLC